MVNSPATVLLVTKQKDTGEAVTRRLHGEELFTLAGLCADLDDLRKKLTQVQALVVLVDIDPRPGPLLKQLEPLAARFRELRFVLLSDEFGPELLLEAMQVGARHLLLKSAIKADLVTALYRLLPSGGNGLVGDGTIITLLSGSGGCGATTLAFNLANELTLASARQALLIDLDWYYGGIAPYLGLQGRYGIGDLLARESPVDGNLVRSSTVAFSDNLHVLLSPVSINALQCEAVHNHNMKKVLHACKPTYTHTIIDAPRVSRQVATTLAGVSTVVLIVFQLTAKDIQVVRAARAALLEQGIPESRIMLVVNRYDKRSAVSLDEARKVLGNQPLHLIANDYRTAVHNVNFGQSLAETAPSSLMRHDIKQLIDRMGLVQ